jgi:hypothetical protein
MVAPDRAAPDPLVVDDEAGEEILITALGLSVADGDSNHLVADAFLAVPGAVLRD